jgi:hypothetical protein
MREGVVTRRWGIQWIGNGSDVLHREFMMSDEEWIGTGSEPPEMSRMSNKSPTPEKKSGEISYGSVAGSAGVVGLYGPGRINKSSTPESRKDGISTSILFRTEMSQMSNKNDTPDALG